MLQPEDFGLAVANRDEREILFKKQREERGWDDSELWSLYTEITKFVLPRLIEFRKQAFGMPWNCCYKPDGTKRKNGMKRWHKILDKMIAAFTLLGRITTTREERATIKNGLRLFTEYYQNIIAICGSDEKFD